MKIKPVSLFGKKPENSTIEFIRPFSGTKKIFKARENGKINPFQHLSYESPVGYFEKCIVLGGMYPFDPVGHFWYGTTYFQSGLSCQIFRGWLHIIREFRQAWPEQKLERTGDFQESSFDTWTR